MPYLGAHVSISGGVFNAPLNGRQLGCEAIQIFTKNQKQWQASQLSVADIEKYQHNLRESGLRLVVSHDSYLINLCAPNPDTRQKSITALTDELQRCAMLSIPFLVAHPGAHGGSGEEWGICEIAASLNKIHTALPDCPVMTLLETTAGQGTNIGWRFEHLREIIDRVEDQHRVGVCADTCHLFAAGYDLIDPANYQRTWQDFDSIIGLSRLKVIHLNDSKKPLGSRVDRHDNIGAGLMAVSAFEQLVNDARFRQLPMILETPGDDEGYIRDLQILRGLYHDKEQ